VPVQHVATGRQDEVLRDEMQADFLVRERQLLAQVCCSVLQRVLQCVAVCGVVCCSMLWCAVYARRHLSLSAPVAGSGCARERGETETETEKATETETET